MSARRSRKGKRSLDLYTPSNTAYHCSKRFCSDTAISVETTIPSNSYLTTTCDDVLRNLFEYLDVMDMLKLVTCGDMALARALYRCCETISIPPIVFRTNAAYNLVSKMRNLRRLNMQSVEFQLKLAGQLIRLFSNFDTTPNYPNLVHLRLPLQYEECDLSSLHNLKYLCVRNLRKSISHDREAIMMDLPPGLQSLTVADLTSIEIMINHLSESCPGIESLSFSVVDRQHASTFKGRLKFLKKLRLTCGIPMQQATVQALSTAVPCVTTLEICEDATDEWCIAQYNHGSRPWLSHLDFSAYHSVTTFQLPSSTATFPPNTTHLTIPRNFPDLPVLPQKLRTLVLYDDAPNPYMYDWDKQRAGVHYMAEHVPDSCNHILITRFNDCSASTHCREAIRNVDSSSADAGKWVCFCCLLNQITPRYEYGSEISLLDEIGACFHNFRIPVIQWTLTVSMELPDRLLHAMFVHMSEQTQLPMRNLWCVPYQYRPLWEKLAQADVQNASDSSLSHVDYRQKIEAYDPYIDLVSCFAKATYTVGWLPLMMFALGLADKDFPDRGKFHKWCILDILKTMYRTLSNDPTSELSFEHVCNALAVLCLNSGRLVDTWPDGRVAFSDMAAFIRKHAPELKYQQIVSDMPFIPTQLLYATGSALKDTTSKFHFLRIMGVLDKYRSGEYGEKRAAAYMSQLDCIWPTTNA